MSNVSLETNDQMRVMVEDDLDLVLAWRNSKHVRRNMFTSNKISYNEHQEWFDRTSADPYKHLMIFEIDRVAVGFVQFSQINTGLIADWGFYTAPDAVKGTGRRLGKSALDFAFEQIKLHKVCGQALAFNTQSIGFHKSLGFKQEGHLRHQHFDGENYIDVLHFGLLASDW